MQAKQARQVRLDPETVGLAVEALLSEHRMVRRAGVIGWPIELWDAAKRRLREMDEEENETSHKICRIDDNKMARTLNPAIGLTQ